VRERIQIDGDPISPQAFVDLWSQVAPIIDLADARSAARGGPRLSFFEVFTVLAFAAFSDAPVDVAVIEVGIGGSWDATNVADGEVAVIGPVSLDHQKYLGHDLAGIAREKAGIIKPAAAAVIALQSESVAPVLRAAVAAAGARALWEDDDIEVATRVPAVGGQLVTLRTAAATYEDLFIPLLGEQEAHTALLWLAAAEALHATGGESAPLAIDVVREGFAAATSPGRLEVARTSPVIVVDAAHNPHGVAALVDALEENFSFEALVGVVAVLADKDAEGILAALEPVLDEVVITEVASSVRATPVEALAAVAREVFGPDRVRVEARLPDAIDAAVQRAEGASAGAGGVIVTGSVLLVAEARMLLGLDRPPRLGETPA
jgi:dihydrofolate synthase/folylpolyglutamate synthase